MTPSINKVFKLIFHNLTQRYPPPAPLKDFLIYIQFEIVTALQFEPILVRF